MRDESEPHIVNEIHEIWGVNSLHDRIFTIINQKFKVGQTFSGGEVMEFLDTNLEAYMVYEAFMWLAYRDSGISVSYHDTTTGERWGSVEGLQMLAELPDGVYQERAENIMMLFTLDECLL
jgi:hypothetical protein